MDSLTFKKKLVLEKIKKNSFLGSLGYNLYYCTYAKNIGNAVINDYAKGRSLLKNFIIICKDILFTAFYSKISIHKKKFFETNYENIIVTWSKKKQFKKDGSFYDNILNTNSKSVKNTLWFVIYIDKELPFKFNKNIVLLRPLKNKFFNILFLFIKFISTLKIIIKTKSYNLNHFSSYSMIANLINDKFKGFLHKDIKLIIMPYESQPFQNKIFLTAQQFSKKIKTFGYVHSPPEAMPTHVIKKNGDPQKIILNGLDQLFCYTKFLNWKKKDILILDSIRFKKNIKSLQNKIFLPIFIENADEIFQCLKLLYTTKTIDIKSYEIRPHPHEKNNKKSYDLIKKINNLNKLSYKFRKNKKMSIFIGATGAAIEHLERGNEAIHISLNPILEIYSNKFYPSIKVTKINENIYKYKLTKKGRIIKLGKRKNNIDYYLKNIKKN